MNELLDGCVVCGAGPAVNKHRIDEIMFRIGETFDYKECSRCGSLQICNSPADLGHYYDFNAYYSYGIRTSKLLHPALSKMPIRQALRVNTALYLRTGLGRGVSWARNAGIAPRDRILDLGCGGGENLLRLHLYGYRNLVGADPFLDADHEVAPGVRVLKQAHNDVDGIYDWVMLHHVFEHVPDPRAVLTSARRLLAPGGGLLVRMPVMGAYAWRCYGPLWVQIDAPRHLVLFTVDGFRELALGQGFQMERIVFDSTGFQFWGSEMVSAGEPPGTGPASRFTAADLERWEREADRLNAASDGDQAMYVLRLA